MINKNDIYNTCAKLKTLNKDENEMSTMFVSVFDTLCNYYDDNIRKVNFLMDTICSNKNVSYKLLDNQEIKLCFNSNSKESSSGIEDKTYVYSLQEEYNQLIQKNHQVLKDLAGINKFVLGYYTEEFMSGIVPVIENEGCNILEAQEKERSRIACDLHDTVIQNLTNLAHKAELSIKLIDQDVIEAKLELQIMIHTIRSAINDIRRIVYNLRPMAMEDLGLCVAIQRFLEIFEKDHKIEIKLDLEERVEHIANSIVSITFFRIIQEACSNAVKHGQASKIFVCLSCTEDMIYLKVKDNGNGFKVEEKLCQGTEYRRNSNTGFGLSIMKERVYLLSGNINIESLPDEGTEIFVQVPVVEYKEEI